MKKNVSQSMFVFILNIITMIMTVLAVFGSITYLNLSQKTEQIGKEKCEMLEKEQDCVEIIEGQTRLIRSFIETGIESYYEEYSKAYATISVEDELLQMITEYSVEEQERQFLSQMAELSTSMSENVKSAISEQYAGNYKSAKNYMYGSSYESALKKFLSYHNEIQKSVKANTSLQLKEIRNNKSICFYIIIILLIIIFLDQIILSLFVKNKIVVPVNKVTKQLLEISEGNLNADFDLTYNDTDIGTLIGAIYTIRENYSYIISNFRLTAAKVEKESENMAVSSRELSTESIMQAEKIEKLAHEIENISTKIQKTSEQAGEANQKARRAEEEMKNANLKIEELHLAIDDLTRTSRQISDIIDIINDISFQTNILSLNAAVEAGRSNMEGKGFSVVAEEIKELAGKSSEAVEEITKLIGDSVEAMNRGTKIATETATLVGKVMTLSKEMNLLTEQISIAADQEALTIQKTSQDADQVSRVIHSNASMAEKSSNISGELNDEAVLLKELIDGFKLENQE